MSVNHRREGVRSETLRVRRASLLCTALSGVVVSVAASPQTQQDRPIVEELAAVVVFVTTRHQAMETIDGKRYEVFLRGSGESQYIPKSRMSRGTGVLLSEGDSLFLATAEHVASETSENTEITIRTDEDRPLTVSLADLIGKKEAPRWRMHDKADIAVLLLHPSQSVSPTLSNHFLDAATVRPALEAPTRERPVTALGFPLGLGVGERFSPISLESKPASGLLTLSRGDGKGEGTFFLLDSPSIGGLSGAPVFHLPGLHSSGRSMVASRDLEVVGLVHGTVSDETGGKMAAVVPASFLRETLELAKQAQ